MIEIPDRREGMYPANTASIWLLAKGVAVATIRYHEQEGLLDEPARTEANYRRYGPDAIKRLAFARRSSKQVGGCGILRETVVATQSNGATIRRQKNVVQQ